MSTWNVRDLTKRGNLYRTLIEVGTATRKWRLPILTNIVLSRLPLFSKFPFVDDRSLIDAVFLDHLTVVEHVKFFRSVLSCEQHDRLFTSRMVRKEFGDVVDPM